MGMKVAFTGGADFSDIGQGRYKSYVTHKAFIKVNEIGTEGAAATIIGEFESVTDKVLGDFVADHPFVLFIRDNITGPILFLSKVLKFADNKKVFTTVKTDADKGTLQDDIIRLVKWSEKWQILFNFGKCKCIHIGHGNMSGHGNVSKVQFTGYTILGTSVKEKDLGVTVSADMTLLKQCGFVAANGNHILGLISRNITYMEKILIKPLYKAIVKPHLEYCIQAWRPYHKTDINKLERVQRKPTKRIPELKHLRYERRLLEYGLTTIETRRLRGDLIKVFKILNGYEDIDSKN